MCDGSLERIDQLHQGDWVWARDADSGEESCRQVERVWLHQQQGRQVELGLESQGSGALGWLVATADHPMMRPGGQQVGAGELVPGQELGGLGGPVRVVSVEVSVSGGWCTTSASQAPAPSSWVRWAHGSTIWIHALKASIELNQI